MQGLRIEPRVNHIARCNRLIADCELVADIDDFLII